MSQEQLEEGKRWITLALSQFASDAALEISRCEWHKTNEDANTGNESLEVEARGRRVVERFPLDWLEDIPGDSGVRNGVADHLRRLVARLKEQAAPTA